MIIPFVQIYTNGITDANYYRPVFATILVIVEFLYAIKLPYDLLINSVGHFKQTKKLAYTEAIINVIFSIILITKFGIVGVVIGTLIATIYKACVVIYYFPKVILKRSLKTDFKFLLLLCMQSIIIILFGKIIINHSEIIGYLSWFILAVKLGVIAVSVQISMSYIFYKDLMLKLIEKIKERKRKYLV